MAGVRAGSRVRSHALSFELVAVVRNLGTEVPEVLLSRVGYAAWKSIAHGMSEGREPGAKWCMLP